MARLKTGTGDLDVVGEHDPAFLAAWTHHRDWIAAVHARDREVRPDIWGKQVPPGGDWSIWILISGRGFGKTRACAEAAFWQAVCWPGSIGGVIAPTHDSLKKICIHGKSGLASVIPQECLVRPIPRTYPMTIELWNGSIIEGYSADAADRLRGPEFDWAWVDELAVFDGLDAEGEDSPWSMLQFCMRSGRFGDPKQFIATTPRPRKVIRELVKRPDVHVVRGSSYENRPNLAESWYRHLVSRYEGTRLGRQEIGGELLEDIEGALWTLQMIDQHRVQNYPDLERVVVGVDPPGSIAECGIVVAGKYGKHRYVLDDRSRAGSPREWATAVVRAYTDYDADAIVVETNFGGQMVRNTIEQVQPYLPIIEVRASRGKQVRAEPISALYEQGRAHHVGGSFSELEDQMTTWVQGDPSPDRMDALVWAMTELEQSVDFRPW